MPYRCIRVYLFRRQTGMKKYAVCSLLFSADRCGDRGRLLRTFLFVGIFGFACIYDRSRHDGCSDCGHRRSAYGWFCDTTDALSSHQPRERKLEILKDSHTGAFAVIWCAVYFILYFGCAVSCTLQTYTVFCPHLCLRED